MPGAPHLRPRFPQAQPPYINGTSPATTAAPPPPPAATTDADGSKIDEKKTTEQTPTYIPTPSYVPVQVVPASELPATTTAYTSIPKYEGSNAVILKGYCTEPNYTILDGPTAFWVPVVGCISSKAECCPTSTTDGGGNAAPTEAQKADPSAAPSVAAGGAGSAAFPISSLPSQGSLTGCPKDYHTVKASLGAGCCPSSYWLWTATLGGQIPCYSSLGNALVPPPMPDRFGRMDLPGSVSASSTSPIVAQTMQQKPTLAIVNIAYAMQYQLAPEPEPKPGLKKGAKIGIGAGVAGASLLFLVVLAFVIRRFVKQKKNKSEPMEVTSASQRFSSQIDMSRVAHEPAGVARTYGGVKYAGVSTRPVEY